MTSSSINYDGRRIESRRIPILRDWKWRAAGPGQTLGLYRSMEDQIRIEIPRSPVLWTRWPPLFTASPDTSLLNFGVKQCVGFVLQRIASQGVAKQWWPVYNLELSSAQPTIVGRDACLFNVVDIIDCQYCLPRLMPGVFMYCTVVGTLKVLLAVSGIGAYLWTLEPTQLIASRVGLCERFSR